MNHCKRKLYNLFILFCNILPATVTFLTSHQLSETSFQMRFVLPVKQRQFYRKLRARLLADPVCYIFRQAE